VSDPLEARSVAERTVYQGRVVDLRVETIEFADGSRHEREIVGHRGAVAILALDGEDLLLVRQHRAAARRVLLEIPAGTRDPLPDGGIEAPEATAPRELAEETGMNAAAWRHLARFWTAPGFATELMDLYLATGLTPAENAAPPEDEHLELERVPWRRAVEMVERGEIADAKSIVGILWFARLVERGEVSGLS
jgi:ADP-ribose pyrophosphatase